MKELWLITFIWAFSYSIIGAYIAPHLDAYMAVLIRSIIGFLIFLPFIKKMHSNLKISLLSIGALQFGITYVLLYKSYNYLSTQEVLLFTITTPLFVTLIEDFFIRKINIMALLTAILAVAGAFIMRFNTITGDYLWGFMLLQLANFCFALGQVSYRNVSKSYPHVAHHAFVYFFLGACIINILAYYLWGNTSRVPEILGGIGKNLSSNTWLAIGFVSIIATGLGQYLWCVGAKKVKNAASLAIMNNAVIPIGLIVNMLFWEKAINIKSFILGLLFMLLAWYLSQFKIKSQV